MTTRLIIPIFLVAILVGPSFAQDEDPAVKEEAARQLAIEKQAKVSIEIFRREFKSREKGRKMMAILTLAQIKHDLVIEELGGKPLNDRDPEVRDAVAQTFADFEFNVPLAGGFLRSAFARNDDEPEVLRSLVRSIAKLGYKDALAQLKETARHLNEEKYKWVTVEVVRAFGDLEDPRCLPFLLWMAEYGGHALKWSTGEVNVDTGASGTADADAAEAAWKAKYGGVKPKKPPAPVIRTYMDELKKALRKLTGQEFESATALRKWLEENARDLGLDPRNLDKD